MAPSKIPVDTLYHVTIVARDARQTALEHARFYGIPDWKVVDHSPERLRRTSIHGRGPSRNLDAKTIGNASPPGEFGFLSARGTSRTRGVTFEIIQPTTGLSTFEHFLATRGEGVHSICLTLVRPQEIDALRRFFLENHVPLGMSYALNDAVDFLYFDTRKMLGGFYTEVIVAKAPAWESTIPADESWNFSAEIPTRSGARPSQRIQGIGHFGVVVPDVEAYTVNFARLFGHPIWRVMNWRTSEWLLEDTTHNGVPVWHSFYTARANVGKTPLGVPVGFEIIQPLRGPSHYKEDFLLLLGPGIHHLDLAFPVEGWNEWAEFNAWIDEDFAAPVCMSGWLRGRSQLYQYQDTRKRLGYVCEVHAPAPEEPAKPGKSQQYWVDFSVPSEV